MDKVQTVIAGFLKLCEEAVAKGIPTVVMPVENLAALAAFVGMYRDRAIAAEALLQAQLAKDAGTLQ
jgi:hypothetical protein